jgi:methylglyoxal synthase
MLLNPLSMSYAFNQRVTSYRRCCRTWQCPICTNTASLDTYRIQRRAKRAEDKNNQRKRNRQHDGRTSDSSDSENIDLCIACGRDGNLIRW